MIDTYALLSTSGTGDFLKTIAGKDMLPTSAEASIILLENVLSARESEACVAILQLHQDIVRLGSRLGQLGHGFRGEIYSGSSMFSLGGMDITTWQQRVAEVQTALRHIWATKVPPFIPSGWLRRPHNLPSRVMALFEHVSYDT
jgi:hypothetical protein